MANGYKLFNKKKRIIKTLQEELIISKAVEQNLREALALIPLDKIAMGDLWLASESTIITIKHLSNKTLKGEKE
jgi:hypothetical protein